jgi:hypothetical protein
MPEMLTPRLSDQTHLSWGMTYITAAARGESRANYAAMQNVRV